MPSKSLGSLIVDLEARTAKFDASLARMEKDLKRSSKRVKKETDFIKKAFVGLISIAVVKNAATAVGRIADEMTGLKARVRDATKDTGGFNTVWADLGKTAAQTGASMDATVDVFQRLTFVRKDLNATNDDMLRFSKAVQQLGVISGASTSAMRAGLTQVGQGLGEGTFRAQEWNSVMENLPAVARAIAEGFGVTTGQMRNLVIEGKVASKEVFNVILAQTGEINERFAEMPLTMERAGNALATTFSLVVAELNESLGITELIAESLQNINASFKIAFAQAFRSELENARLEVEKLERVAAGGNLTAFLRHGFDGAQELADELLSARIEYTELTKRAQVHSSTMNDAKAKTTALAGATKDLTGGMDTKNKKLTEQERKLKADAVAATEAKAELAELAKAYGDFSTAQRAQASSGSMVNRIGTPQNNQELATANKRLQEIAASTEQMNAELVETQRLSDMLTVTWGNVWADLINNVSDAWSSFFLDVFHGEGLDSIKSFLNRVKEMFFQIIAEIAAKWVTSQIFGGLIGGTGLGGLVGGGGIGGLGGLVGLGGKGGKGLLGLLGLGPAAKAGPAIATGIGVPGGAIPGVQIAGGAGTGGLVGGTGLTQSAIIAGKTGGVGALGGGGAAAAGIASGQAGIAVAGAAFPYIAIPIIAAAAINHFMGSGKRAATFLQENAGVENYSEFRTGRGVVGLDQNQQFADFLETRGVSNLVNQVDYAEGSFFGSKTGREGDARVDIGGLFEEMERLKELLPEIQALAAKTFESMGVSAEEIGTILHDGTVTNLEQAQIGMVNLGDLSVEKFGEINQAVENGSLRMQALTGEVAFSREEIGLLGSIGVLNINALANSVGLSDKQLERLITTTKLEQNEMEELGLVGRKAMDFIDVGTGKLSNSMGSAADSARSLASAIKSIPSPPSVSGGGISGKHSGGSFQVRGRAGVDSNLVSFMATAGERVHVETPGTTQSTVAQSGVSSELMDRLDRLIGLMEAA